MAEQITSMSNSKVKNVIKCGKSAKERRKQGVFLIEGLRMFAELPPSLHVETFTTQQFYSQHKELFEGLTFYIVSDPILNAMADTQTPQGVVSLVRQLQYQSEDLQGEGVPLLLALENLQDPGNLGTILRTAEGAGVTGLLLSKDTVDIYNPKVVRSTMGSIFRMPFLYVENLTDTVQSYQQKGYCSYSAHLQGSSFYDENYRKPTIFCIGNEGNGLSKELTETTTAKIRIPMCGKVESLNAATAATVLMYEAMRQRSTGI